MNGQQRRMNTDCFPAFYAAAHSRHDPQQSREVPQRAEELLRGAREAGAAFAEPADWGLGPIAAVHTAELLDLLSTAYARFSALPGGSRPAIPDSFATRHLGGRASRSIWGQLGHHCTDTVTPIGPDTWDAAYWAAQTALTAAAAADAGSPLAYALCRPPGHHAYADLYGGFCYLNNAAIAAAWLAARGRRVAILDIDYHHGNGTQGIFYDRSDVFTCSVHADPEDEYPYFCGHADERGIDGRSNCNFPLPLGTGDAPYLDTLDCALAAVNAAQPDVLLVSLGLDTLADDPHGGFCLTAAGLGEAGLRIGRAGLPLLVVQEGGYLLPSLRPALAAFLSGAAAGRGSAA